MNGYLKRFNLTDDDNCEKCLVTDDNIHRIYDCTRIQTPNRIEGEALATIDP
jgi:hypothetical protein